MYKNHFRNNVFRIYTPMKMLCIGGVLLLLFVSFGSNKFLQYTCNEVLTKLCSIMFILDSTHTCTKKLVLNCNIVNIAYI